MHALARGDALLSPEVTRRVIARFAATPAAAATGVGAGGAEPDASAPMVAPNAVLEQLTDRERETLLLLARGRSNAEIAKELFVGEATVKTHVSNVLLKLGIRDRIHAVIWAYEHGVVAPER